MNLQLASFQSCSALALKLEGLLKKLKAGAETPALVTKAASVILIECGAFHHRSCSNMHLRSSVRCERECEWWARLPSDAGRDLRCPSDDAGKETGAENEENVPAAGQFAKLFPGLGTSVVRSLILSSEDLGRAR